MAKYISIPTEVEAFQFIKSQPETWPKWFKKEIDHNLFSEKKVWQTKYNDFSVRPKEHTWKDLKDTFFVWRKKDGFFSCMCPYEFKKQYEAV